MIAKDLMPFNITEREGFKALLKTTSPLYKPPGRKSITEIIDKKYEALSYSMKQEILNVGHITITTDVWTETMTTTSYLGITAHFIRRQKLKSVTIGVKELSESHTAEYLAACLKDICNEWNITSDKIITVVTDNGANIVKAVSDAYGKNKHLPCFAHTLNLVATSTLSLPSIKIIKDKISSIVTYFKQSVTAADKLRKSQSTTEKLKLIQQVPTRWNSTFFMVDRFLKLSPFIAPILLTSPSSPDMLSAVEMQISSDMVKVLRPIENVSREICGEKYATASKIIPIINCLTKELETLHPGTEETQKMLDTAKTEIKKRFGAAEKVKILAMATVLDPRFKKIHFQDPLAYSQAISNINVLIDEFRNRDDISEAIEPDPIGPEQRTLGLWSHHESLVSSLSHSSYHKEGEINYNLKLYLEQPVSALKTDPITFWHNYKEVSICLATVAEQLCCVVGTSVPSERLFSQASLAITQARNRILGKRLSKILFLHSLDTEDWHMKSE